MLEYKEYKIKNKVLLSNMLKIQNKHLIISLILYLFINTNLIAENNNITEPENNQLEQLDINNTPEPITKSRVELLEELEYKIQNNYSILNDLNLDISDINSLSTNPENYVVIYLENIALLIQLYPNIAPNSVARFKDLIRNNFYEKTNFFRFIPNYIIQAGDPSDSRYGGEGKVIPIEKTSTLNFSRGIVALANNGKVNDSQFFISYNSFPWLDGTATIIGKVVSGMDALDNLNVSTYNNDGILDKPIPILKMFVLGDEKKQ
jgi:peptidylprolyl isomerase